MFPAVVKEVLLSPAFPILGTALGYILMVSPIREIVVSGGGLMTKLELPTTTSCCYTLAIL